jgi:ABC-type transport system involved in multi-copper enzyme maturation permease subunit
VGLIGAVLTGLAVSGEFEWRTSRQNVIDGLSRNSWLLGKALLLPTITATLYGTQIALGTGLALIDTQPAHQSLSYPAYTYLTAGFGVWLGLCIHAVVALLISLWVRSSGPAIGLIFICQIFDSVAARVLQGFHLDRIAAWLPFQIHTALLSFSQYLPDSSSALAHPWSTGHLMLAGIGWMAALAAASAWIYLRRDL